MIDSYFRTPRPIEVEITVERDSVVGNAVSILNKMAEARYDGENAKYVNNMQPEMDFEQDRLLVYGYYDEAVGNVARRIEPYVRGYGEDKTVSGNYVFSLVFPEKWKRQEEPVLRIKINNYIVQFIIANWLEKVSMSDIAYSMEKAEETLFEVKYICEKRQGMVHRGYNTTY